MRKPTPALLALALSIAACGGNGSSDTTTTPATGTTVPTNYVLITIDSLSFPAEVTIPAGRSAAWENEMLVNHQIVFETHDGQPVEMDSYDVTGGRIVEVSLEPGTWAYFCGFHPQMTGTLVVEG